jgi:putative transposase
MLDLRIFERNSVRNVVNRVVIAVVHRFYPFSKFCSCCGQKKVSLSLSERTYCCDYCGMEMDRNFNASLNLKYATDYTVVTSR